MNRLTHRDLRGAFHFLSACDAGSGLQAFGVSVAEALPKLISCDVAVFALANLRGQTMMAVENPRVTSAADLETYMRVTRETSNPIIEHFARTRDAEARRMSDFVTRRQFHDLPLYTDFYRRMRLESILGTPLNDSPTAFDGVTLNRAGRDFTERDRALLTLLRPHLVQGYRTALAVDRLRADLVMALQSLELPGFGLVVLAETGRVQLMSPGAAVLLTSYFGTRRPARALPTAVNDWVLQHSDAVRDASRLSAPVPPMVVERNGTSLTVRLVRVGHNTLLLLEEPATRPAWLRLVPLGLTTHETSRVLECLRRELVTGDSTTLADVAGRLNALVDEMRPQPGGTHRLTPHELRLLRLLVEGHTYTTAAASLGSSLHTVAFHMKHIYEKLEVHSKSQAVAKALRAGIV